MGAAATPGFPSRLLGASTCPLHFPHLSLMTFEYARVFSVGDKIILVFRTEGMTFKKTLDRAQAASFYHALGLCLTDVRTADPSSLHPLEIV